MTPATPEALTAAIARRDELKRRRDSAVPMWLIAQLGNQLATAEAEVQRLQSELAR